LALIFFGGGELGVPEFSSYGGVTCSQTQVRSGAYSYFFNGAGWWIRQTFSAAIEFYVTGTFYFTSFGTNQILWNFKNGTHSIVTLRCNGVNNPFTIYLGTGLVATGTFTPLLNTWYIIELHVKIHATTGLLEFKIQGSLDASFSGDTSSTGYLTLDSIELDGSNWTGYVDDIVINNPYGISCNQWMGGARIVSLKPSGPGSLTQWTPSVGVNWECVNEIPFSSVDYVTSNIIGMTDLYTLEHLPAGVCSNATIQAMRITNVALKSTSALANIQNVIKINSEINAASALPLSLVESLVSSYYDTNPVSGLTWDYNTINALEAGVKVA
jgi:hypothetical protein